MPNSLPLPAPRAMREVFGLTPTTLTDALLTSTEPLILRGLASAWPMVQAALTSSQAAASYLRRFYRGAPVMAMLATPEAKGRFFYNADINGFNFFPARTTLDLVLGEIEDHRNDLTPPAIYVGSTAVDTCLPGFRTENDLGLGERDPMVSIWMGNQTRIAAHFDCPDNVACVAAGHRRFTVFPPEQLRNLYIGPLEFNPAGQAISLVDFAQPDLAKFPKFADAMEQAQVADLGPGDAIFIPSMWWHHVEALDHFNVLVNYWWRRTPAFMDTPSNALMLAMLSIRDLPLEQRRAWQEHFRHYVFEADGSESAHIPPAAQRCLAPLDADSAAALDAFIMQKLKRS